jgi:hypothetical protein
MGFFVDPNHYVVIAQCGTCDRVGDSSVVAKVIIDPGYAAISSVTPSGSPITAKKFRVLIPTASLGSTIWPELSEPHTAIAVDPSMRDSERVNEHRRRVREHKESPLPGVTVRKISRTQWTALNQPSLAVACRRGHKVRIIRERLERAALHAVDGKPATIYLGHNGKLVPKRTDPDYPS